jgi:hypothetical protein
MEHINVDKRREWLRALRRFKQGMKVRARMGVIQAICDRVGEERTHVGGWVWGGPYDPETWVEVLHVCIRDNQFPPELLEAFVKSSEVTYFSPTKQPTAEAVLKAVDWICNQHSKELRRKFGVFG